MKKQEGEVLPALIEPMIASLKAHLDSSLIEPLVSLLVKDIFKKRVSEKEGGILLLLATPLLLKGLMVDGLMVEQTFFRHK